MKLFLDCDGVLADFDAQATKLFGMDPRKYEDIHGSKSFWKAIRDYPGGFFETLPLMSDAMELWNAVAHLNPTILTGCPQGNWAQPQKVTWAKKTFGPETHIITCSSRDKRIHMHEAKHNIIVDDWPKYKNLWEEHGGTFILHTSAADSINQLRGLGVL